MRANDEIGARSSGAFRVQGIGKAIRPGFTNNAVDVDGNVILDAYTTVTLEDQSGKTKMAFHTKASGTGDRVATMLQGMEQGWSESFDKFNDKLHALNSNKGDFIMTGFNNASRAALCGAAFAMASCSMAWADSAPAAAPTMPMGQHDAKLAPAGTYTLDPNHVGVIARVSHMGFSISVFRFGKVAATLEWNPADVAKSKLHATVETNSIETNVPGFAEELAGDRYLKSAKFPQATFVSTAFRQTDAQHGKVDGDFTLMGKTVPVTFDVSLVGAGPGFAGGPVMGHVIGIHAETAIHPQDFAMPPFFSTPIELVIDTEFDKPGK